MTKRTIHLPGIVILAAGSSSRLGQPKQLLLYEGISLIQRTIQMAASAVEGPVVVVLGAHSSVIHPQLMNLPVYIVYNDEWEEGMSSSIKKGLKAMLHFSPETDAVIFAVCDQPHISTDLFSEMVARAATTDRSIVACSYRETLGTPVLFTRAHFDELLALKKGAGAKEILGLHRPSVEEHPFPLGWVDIDTMQDYESLQKPVM